MSFDPLTVPVLMVPSKSDLVPLTLWSTGEGTMDFWAADRDALQALTPTQVKRGVLLLLLIMLLFLLLMLLVVASIYCC